MSIDPGEASASTSTNAADPRRKISPPSALSLGIIVWTDDPQVEPTVIADRNPATLMRTVAVTTHEMLEDSEAYAGATEFLQSNPPPQASGHEAAAVQPADRPPSMTQT